MGEPDKNKSNNAAAIAAFVVIVIIIAVILIGFIITIQYSKYLNPDKGFFERMRLLFASSNNTIDNM